MQVDYLTSKYHVYLLKNGRINMCGLNAGNMEYVADAIKDAVTTHPENWGTSALRQQKHLILYYNYYTCNTLCPLFIVVYVVFYEMILTGFFVT